MAEILGDLEYFRGDSEPITIKIKDKATQEYVDITGHSFLFTVNTTKDPTDETQQLFQLVGVVAPDQIADKGQVSFTPTTVETDQTVGTYYFDIQRINTATNKKTIAKFKFKLDQDITKI